MPSAVARTQGTSRSRPRKAQTLPCTDDGTGDEASHQSGGGAIDATGDRTAGDAGDGEREESGGPDQPGPQEGVSAARRLRGSLAILLAPEGTGSVAAAREPAG